jgi:hypothetical protein
VKALIIPAAALILGGPAPAEVLVSFDFAGGSTASTDTSAYSTVSAYDPRSAAVGGDDSAASSVTETAYMRAENTPGGTDPTTNAFYHSFNFTITGLAAGESFDLSSLTFDYFATNISGAFLLGVYSDAVGYTGTAAKLATTNISTNTGDSFTVNLTPANPVAGNAFTGLTNGRTIEFRFVFGDNSTSNNSIHRLDNITLNGTVDDGSEPDPNLLVNPGFEDTPFDNGWNSSGVITETGMNGSATAARLGYNTTATLGQTFAAAADFTVDAYFQIAGNSTDDSFHLFLDTTAGNAIEIRGATGNVLQVNDGGVHGDLTALSDGASFPVPTNAPIRIRVIGRGFGTATANYDIAWSDPGTIDLTHAATGLTAFILPSAATTGTGLTGIRFDRTGTSGHSYWVDDVGFIDTAAASPSADFGYTPPVPDKVVRISGVYPHLAMTNDSNECGPGAIVPWAGRLWAVTYSPHAPTGSSSRLYEIDSALNRLIRPESLGGTPANRFIHTPSNQLIIGPHFIDASRQVRNLPYLSAPGRHTGMAAHLSDPDHRVYLMTMENGLYDVNVNDLSVITRYPDLQGRGDRFLHGYHGKGLYSGQGLLVAANNGRPNNQGDPTGEAGVLATWDGTTVAENGGSYLATNDPNTGIGDNTGSPVAAQADYIAGWNQVAKVQTCEVTGPGGIHGNPNPATDPIWTTGFDSRSVILRTLESGTWHTWRLPKGSYTHDGSHGWHTEWPRIRQLDPGTPGSPYLMHMHGLFFNFPVTFSSTDFSGLTPLCGYHKMPVDYCIFNGKLVIAKNDASKFSNALARKAQSNLWWGQLSDLQKWGAPTGHGSVWMNQTVASGETSDPFLINGFSQGTLHLRNNGGASVPVVIETSNGTTWSTLRTLDIPANGYLHDNIGSIGTEWVRLRADAASSDLTAFFHLSNPYPHSSLASLGTDAFAAIADIRDTSGCSDGIIRVMTGDDLRLEFASNSGYHRIGGQIVLEDVTSASAEAALRADAALTREFGSDAASAWIDAGGTRFRVPKLDPLYDAPFLSGWARGEREAVTERKLFNLHGTFYEVPRDNSGGKRKMRALATHGKRITDFASWRGLFVITGVLDDAPDADSLARNPSGKAALWLGEVDDLWQMGEPRGTGGPWRVTAVTAGTPSDPFLMYGYDRKDLVLSHTADTDVTFKIEVDFLADNTWSTYDTFTVPTGGTFTHQFPAGFHAHWVRVTSDTTTTATAQFTYGPADQRDTFLDWAREESLPTGAGRTSVATTNTDGDPLNDLAEFVLGTDPSTPNEWPLEVTDDDLSVILRDLDPADGITVTFESSTDLQSWDPYPMVSPSPDQSGVPSGFTRQQVVFLSNTDPQCFVRIAISL